MILLAELMILVSLGTLAVQGVDFRENHACQNRRQTAMISFAELLNFMVLGILAVQGVDFRENHACQNRRQTNIILLAEFVILVVLRTLVMKRVYWRRWAHENHVKYVCWGRSGHSSGVAESMKTM